MRVYESIWSHCCAMSRYCCASEALCCATVALLLRYVALLLCYVALFCFIVVALCWAIVFYVALYCAIVELLFRHFARLLCYPPKQCGALRPKKAPGGRHITCKVVTSHPIRKKQVFWGCSRSPGPFPETVFFLGGLPPPGRPSWIVYLCLVFGGFWDLVLGRGR